MCALSRKIARIPRNQGRVRIYFLAPSGSATRTVAADSEKKQTPKQIDERRGAPQTAISLRYSTSDDNSIISMQTQTQHASIDGIYSNTAGERIGNKLLVVLDLDGTVVDLCDCAECIVTS